MIVKCPACEWEYDCTPGKYQCDCGAKFFVSETGDVRIADPMSLRSSADLNEKTTYFASTLSGKKLPALVVLSRIGKKKILVTILAVAALIAVLFVVFALFVGNIHVGVFRKKLSNIEIYELQRKLEQQQSQLSKMDRGQTFGTHIDAFTKYYQIGKDALSHNDFSTASDALQRAEQEAKWLVANAPLREQVRKIADEVEQGKSAADRYDAAERASRSYEAARKEASAATKHVEAGKFETAIREYSQARDGFRKSSGEAKNVMRKEYIRKAEIARDKKDWRTVMECAYDLRGLGDYDKAIELDEAAKKGLKADLLVAAQQAADQRRWDTVKECVVEIRGLGDYDKARELETAANEGLKADLLVAAQQATDKHQWDKVKKYADKIRSLDSAKADEWEMLAREGIKQDKLNSELAAARQAKVSGLWGQVYFHASAVLDISSTHVEAAQLRREAWSKGTTFIFPLSDNITLEMVKVEAGSFEMGANDGENDNCEVPHRVTVTHDFYIGKTEVTQAQWKAVMGYSPSNYKGDELPVDNVSYGDAMYFCRELNKSGKAPEGYEFTLPTEEQWEYAARGGNKSRGYKYSGSNNIEEVAWYRGNSREQTHPVGTKKANELGLYDMSGNLEEWCRDWFRDWYKKYHSNGTGPATDLTRVTRVTRGGNRWGLARDCRSARRSGGFPNYRYRSVGFRLALVPISYK